MNPLVSLLITLGGEVLLVAGVGIATERLLPSVRDRRRLWCAILSIVALLTVVELAGLRVGARRMAIRWMHSAARPTEPRRFVTEVVDPVPSAEVDPSVFAAQIPAPTETPAPSHWPTLLAALWLLGTVSILIRIVLTRRQLRKLVRHSERVDVEAAGEIADRLGLARRRVQLREAAGFGGPVAFGILRPTVLLPRGFATQHEELELKVLLAHELAHLAARDPLWLAISDVLTGLLWWHPAVWWARRRLRATSEAAADEASSLIPGGRIALAEALVAFGHKLTAETSPAGFGVGGLESELAGRVTRLLSAPAHAASRLLTRVTFAGALGIMLAIGIAPWPGEGAQPVLVAAFESIESLESKPVAANGGNTDAKSESSPSNSTLHALRTVQSVPEPDSLATRGSLESIETNRLGNATLVGYDATRVKQNLTQFAFIPAKGGSIGFYNEPLDSIVLPSFELGTITLGEGATALFDLVLKHDPKKTGYPISVGSVTAYYSNGGFGWTNSPALASTRLRHPISLKQVTLRQALDALCESASMVWIPLHGALITQPPSGPVEARQYVLDPVRLDVALTPLYPSGVTNLTYREILNYIQFQGASLFGGGPKNPSTPEKDLSLVFSSLPNAPKQELAGGLEAVSYYPKISTFTVRAPRSTLDQIDRIPFPLIKRKETSRIGTNKLDAITLPFLSIPEGPLEDVAAKLQSRIRDADPEKKSLRVTVATPGLQTGQPLHMGSGPLTHVLEMITDNCTTPVEWMLNGDEIDFRKIASGKWPLRTREFHLDPPTFLALIRSRREKAGNTAIYNDVQAEVRAFCAEQGVVFPEFKPTPGSTTNVAPQGQNAVFFQEQLGTLFVRASFPDLDRLGQALALLTSSPIASELETRPLAKPAPGSPGVEAPGGVYEHTTYIALREADPVKQANYIRELRTRLQQSEDNLRELRTKYRERHPKVVEAVQAQNALEAELEHATAPSKSVSPFPAPAPAGSKLAAPPSTTAGPRKIEVEIKFAEVRESNISGLGLDWIFGNSTKEASVIEAGSAQELGSSLATSQVTPPISQDNRYRVDLLRTVGERAELTPEQFKALLMRLESQPGTELLTAPKVVTVSGQKTKVAVTETKTLVDDVKAVSGSSTNKAAVQYQTRTVDLGPSVEFLPSLKGDSLRMHLTAKVTEFLGYDDPKGQSVAAAQPGGKPLKGIIPIPHVRIRVAIADSTFPLGGTLALRGPLVTETVRVKDKVPVLGDVPLLGRLFRSDSTSTYKKRLYVFVTPTEMDAAGNPK